MIDYSRRRALLFGACAGLYASLPRVARAQLPSDQEWKMAPPLPTAMGEVVGVPIDRTFFVFGGLNDVAGEVPYGTAFRFDSEEARWTVLRDMPQAAHHLMASEYQGKIYIFGGFTLGNQPKMSWQPTDAAWEYDPNTTHIDAFLRCQDLVAPATQ